MNENIKSEHKNEMRKDNNNNNNKERLVTQ